MKRSIGRGNRGLLGTMWRGRVLRGGMIRGRQGRFGCSSEECAAGSRSGCRHGRNQHADQNDYDGVAAPGFVRVWGIHVGIRCRLASMWSASGSRR